MKKLLTILGTVGIIATGSATVVACGSKTNSRVEQETDISKWNLPQEPFDFYKGMSMGEVFLSWLEGVTAPANWTLPEGKTLKDVLYYDTKKSYLNSTSPDGKGFLFIIPNPSWTKTTLTGRFPLELIMHIRNR